MGKRMNWDRAKPMGPAELKYDAGTVLPNGIVVAKPLDSLAKRAKEAEARWLKQNRMTSLSDRPRAQRRKRRKRKDQTFVAEPAPFDDVALTVLEEMDRNA